MVFSCKKTGSMKSVTDYMDNNFDKNPNDKSSQNKRENRYKKQLNINSNSNNYDYDKIYEDIYEKLKISYKEDIRKGIVLLKKFVKFLIKLFLFFILINIVIFSVTIFIQLIQKEYPKQKAILATARNITIMYIIPLSNHYGRTSKYVKPFYCVRDNLYTKGMSMLPENSPEREVWWCKIRFIEFDKIIYKEIIKSSYSNAFKDSDIKEYNNWANELYQHIKILQKADISTIIFKNDILLMYNSLIHSYIYFQSTFSRQQQMLDPFYLKYIQPYRPAKCKKLEGIKLPEHLKQLDNKGRCNPPGPKYDAIKYNIELLKSFDELKEKIKKGNLAAYQLYETFPIIDEYIFYKKAYEKVLDYQATFDKIRCDSPELRKFIDLKIKIINYMINNPNRTFHQDFAYQLSLNLDPFDIPESCVAINNEYKKERDKLHKFYDDRNEEYKKEQERKLRKEKELLIKIN